MKNLRLQIITLFTLTATNIVFGQSWNSYGDNITTGKLGIGTTSLSIGNTAINNLVIGDASSSEGLIINANAKKDGIMAFANNGRKVHL